MGKAQASKNNISIEPGLVTPMENARFTAVCNAVIHSEHERRGIGTLSEKTIHSILKNYLEPDTSFHEIRTGSYVADIRTPEGIYEIQTRQFNKLRNKLASFLDEYPVTVVYPIPHIKYLRWIDDATGEISAPRRSPKRGVFQEVFFELYKIKPYLTHPNFHLLLMLIDIEEYRFLNGWSRDRKKGFSRSDRIPTALYAKETIMTPSDYIKLIPDTVPARFTTKDYARACQITPSAAQTAANVLCHAGVIMRVGKVRNAYLYERCTSKPDT